MTTVGDLLERCEAEGQGHLFRFWEELDEASRGHLLAEVATLDFELLSELKELLAAPPAAENHTSFDPPELFPLQRDGETEAHARAATELVTAIYHSARAGERVDLPIGSEHPLYEGWLPG